MKKKTYIHIFCWIIIAVCLVINIVLIHIKQTISSGVSNPESIQTVFVDTPDIESMPGIEILDANNIYFQLVNNDPNQVVFKRASTISIKQSGCRIKMLSDPVKQIMVKVNNKEYPAVIDTGFSNYFMINDIVIMDNGLKILPLEVNEPHLAGYSWIDEVQIGNMNITDIFAYYLHGHYEKQLNGKTIQKEGQVVLGLKFLRQYKYVLLDNIASEAEFSPVSFQADPNEQWKQYKMFFENNKNNTRAMIEIPIAGENTNIMLDTGAGLCLSMFQSKWEKFSEKINVIKEVHGSAQMLHGLNDFNDVIVEELTVGEKRITNASIGIFSNSSFLGPDYFLLGMDCFKDTVIVLDFEHNLLWVKQSSDSTTNKENS